MIPGVRIVLGLVVLVLGRRLYWIAVGAGGLLAGLEFAEQLSTGWSALTRYLVAIAAGVFGVLLAIFAQRVAFAALGFFSAGFLAIALTPGTSSDGTHVTWFVVGGVAGAIIAALLMDWAIIVLTSLAGAAAIVTSFVVSPVLQAVLFVIVAGVGITIQSRDFKRGTQKFEPSAHGKRTQ